MTGPVLVTGGTGTLGRAVVRRLLADDVPVRVLSRRDRRGLDELAAAEWATADLRDAEAMPRALDGVRAIVHCATQPRHSDVDIDGTRVLVDATHQAANTPHLVYVSIVGIDRVPLGYYRTKLAAERIVTDAGLPWTILRATQFHDLVLRVLRAVARLPVLPVPASTRLQPVDVTDVAARLAGLATGPPGGRVAEFGGPQIRTVADLAAGYLRARGSRRPVVPVRFPGRTARELRRGGLLTPGHADGQRTWEEFLVSRART